MAITNAFKNAVTAGDVRGIRIMMKDSMLVDPTFRQFNQMEKLAKNVSGLYDTHDGRGINEDNTTWDDEYMNTVRVDVIYNFSKERLEHLKKVVTYLRPETKMMQQNMRKLADRFKEEPDEQEKGRKILATKFLIKNINSNIAAVIGYVNNHNGLKDLILDIMSFDTWENPKNVDQYLFKLQNIDLPTNDAELSISQILSVEQSPLIVRGGQFSTMKESMKDKLSDDGMKLLNEMLNIMTRISAGLVEIDNQIKEQQLSK